MSKITPTKEMIEYRKKLAKEQNDHNDKIQDYNQKSELEKQPLRKKIEKLKKDKLLASEAVIGYGLAMKSLEENLRAIELELTEVEQQINKDRPPYRNTFGDFQIKFGVHEHEVEWGEAKL